MPTCVSRSKSAVDTPRCWQRLSRFELGRRLIYVCGESLCGRHCCCACGPSRCTAVQSSGIVHSAPAQTTLVPCLYLILVHCYTGVCGRVVCSRAEDSPAVVAICHAALPYNQPVSLCCLLLCSGCCCCACDLCGSPSVQRPYHRIATICHAMPWAPAQKTQLLCM